MTAIKRFTPDYKMHAVRFEAFAREAEHGEYVRFEDHQQEVTTLKAERDALAVENQALNNFIANSCYVWAGEDPAWHPAIDHSPETPATNQLSVEESRFLTDAITAAGLLSCGKQDKGLARRITDFCVAKIGNSNPAKLRNETPATDSALAAIRLEAKIEGANELAERIAEMHSKTAPGSNIEKKLMFAAEAAIAYANGLREAK
ncbi:hypothetical protein ABK864_01250 [Serratia marcescens]|uniref:hypothetical protein n=1 Tax=Serratia marcescens TaxID=615 RepID=UPI00374FC913